MSPIPDEIFGLWFYDEEERVKYGRALPMYGTGPAHGGESAFALRRGSAVA